MQATEFLTHSDYKKERTFGMLNKLIPYAFIAISLIGCGSLGLTSDPVVVQSNPLTPPSSLPPEGYTGYSWTDNRGCDYLRVANNSWAPKVTQTGSHLCNGSGEGSSTEDVSIDEQLNDLVASQQNVAVSQPINNDAQVDVVISTSIAQVGTFANQGNVDNVVSILKEQGYEAIIQTSPNGLTVVNVKSKSAQTADALLLHMRQLGFTDAFIKIT